MSLLFAAPPPARAGEIHGLIEITHRLTKRRVAPAVAAYSRGVTVAAPISDQGFAQSELNRVAIYLESEPGLPSEVVQAVLEQKDRRFLEETVVVPAGSSVSFPNRDPIFHNVFSLSGAKSFDLGNYTQNETRVVRFPKPGVIRVYCHLHPNMSASIIVTPNRWRTQPGSDGRYRLRDIPPGEHTLVVWHKSAGTFRERVRIAGDETLEIDFNIPLGAEIAQGK